MVVTKFLKVNLIGLRKGGMLSVHIFKPFLCSNPVFLAEPSMSD